jgi:hypothetical protein
MFIRLRDFLIPIECIKLIHFQTIKVDDVIVYYKISIKEHIGCFFDIHYDITQKKEFMAACEKLEKVLCGDKI